MPKPDAVNDLQHLISNSLYFPLKKGVERVILSNPSETYCSPNFLHESAKWLLPIGWLPRGSSVGGSNVLQEWEWYW
jgi:hypothetical protein